LIPTILTSDKTKLSQQSGDKQAWPVYLTIGNIEKATRRKPTARATMLLGYIPVCKLECFSEKKRSAEGYQLFHECMRAIIAPLIKAGRDGVDMNCADGFIRTAFPILSAYIADYPEQCLVTCCRENSCPTCLVKPTERGDVIHSGLRNPKETLDLLRKQSQGEKPSGFTSQNLRPINPFWSDLPHCNIFSCITPDILHQLHKGVFKDHTAKWATEAMRGGSAEVDRRFRAMTPHQSLRHFKKGISLTTQWTGKEYKNMEKVFLGVLAGATDPGVMRAIRAVLDFIYYAHFEIHCDESLAALDAAWLAFHDNKSIFEDLEIRKHFNISKLHNIKHYLDAIRTHGTADGFNTEATERLHIDLAKIGYDASNKKGYIKQMTLWLRRQDSVHRFCQYLQWAIPNYVAELEKFDDSEDDGDDGLEDKDNNIDNEDDDLPHTAEITYRVATTPPFLHLSVADITNNFGATDFIVHLDNFLHSENIAPLVPLSEHSTFSVYNKFSLSLPETPEVTLTVTNDTIHATQRVAGNITTTGLKPETPAFFSTVLVQEHAADKAKGPLHGTWAVYLIMYSQLILV
jgi:Plavaka transposase